MLAYWDTSAVVKAYAAEAGSAAVASLRRKFDVASSVLLPVELRSALFRRSAGGDISAAAFASAELRLSEDRATWRLGPVSALVLLRAETLVVSRSVKSLDAIHIATAEDMQEGFGVPLEFITADRRQAEVAEAAGLAVRYIAAD